jgi:hypothetical protein
MKTTMPVSTPRQLLESEIERSVDLKGLLAADRTDTASMLVISYIAGARISCQVLQAIGASGPASVQGTYT